ncbi:MAG: response regulator [Methylococcales bacterium]|nr:response regulator [Methylococcales bacterium]
MKILIVDGFSTMRRILKNLLNDLGFINVVEADNGKTALATLETSAIDFLITDWNMPEMTGIELLKAVRTNPKLIHIPVLMITAEAKREHIVMAAQWGVNGYLIKPLTALILNERMKKIFRRLEK